MFMMISWLQTCRGLGFTCNSCTRHSNVAKEMQQTTTRKSLMEIYKYNLGGRAGGQSMQQWGYEQRCLRTAAEGEHICPSLRASGRTKRFRASVQNLRRLWSPAVSSCWHMSTLGRSRRGCEEERRGVAGTRHVVAGTRASEQRVNQITTLKCSFLRCQAVHARARARTHTHTHTHTSRKHARTNQPSTAYSNAHYS